MPSWGTNSIPRVELFLLISAASTDFAAGTPVTTPQFKETDPDAFESIEPVSEYSENADPDPEVPECKVQTPYTPEKKWQRSFW